ncbi:ABC transporter ATP-binding protein [Streptococcus devriesei]|uniref:ABC transporter ATP-binding protein n=1 Tax=Streptococcus devriesei TaxID=231233 RepID=UPI0003FFB1A0|nr:ABC transporter ATP-binding protein [Streptococcus devriesei]
MMEDGLNILEVKDLSTTYKNSGFSISDLSFFIPKGCIVGLIGENGSGKTTIINSLLGLKKIDSGKIQYWGKSFDINDIDLKNRIGVCFDEIYLPKNLKISQVERIYRDMYKDWDKDYFYETLKKFNISPTKKISDCSKGMQKMFTIVLAIAANPEFLILDEPTSGLDPVKRKDILNIFQEFVLKESRSILFSSHITTDIEQIADIVMYIREGEIEFIEPITKLLYEYALVRCSEANFKLINQEKILAYQKRPHGYDILISTRDDKILSNSNLVIDYPNLEDIMSIYSKGVIV